jgi:hypothetical protein
LNRGAFCAEDGMLTTAKSNAATRSLIGSERTFGMEILFYEMMKECIRKTLNAR